MRRRLTIPMLEKMVGVDFIHQYFSTSNIQKNVPSNLLNLGEKLYVRELLLSIHEGNSESAHLLGSHFLQHIPTTTITTSTSTISLPFTSSQSELESESEREYELEREKLDSKFPIITKTTKTPINHEFPLDNLNNMFPSRVESSYYWYSKSSSMGNSFGSFQCGLMNHFGIGSKNGINRNLIRGERYYELCLDQMKKENKNEMKVVVEMLLWLLRSSKKSLFVDKIGSVFGWILRWIFFENN